MTEYKNRNILQEIFLSTGENRLRAGWRLVLQTCLLILISIIFSFILFIPSLYFPELLSENHYVMCINVIPLFAGITISIFISRKYFDKRPVNSLGLHNTNLAIKEILVGIGISFFQMGLILLIEIVAGWNKIIGYAWQEVTTSNIIFEITFWLFFFILVGWQEELLSRGYHLQTLESGTNIFWAVVISSMVFGLLHILNPEATWISTTGIFLAGIYLAFPFIITRRLWLSIGLHIGWNFFEGVVFGFPVSGTTTFNIINTRVAGPDLWTGGKFGPEAGLIILPGLFLGFVLVYLYTSLFIEIKHN